MAKRNKSIDAAQIAHDTHMDAAVETVTVVDPQWSSDLGDSAVVTFDDTTTPVADPIPTDPVSTAPDISVEVAGHTLVISVRGFDPIVVDSRTLSVEILSMATMHGLKQKLSDAGAKPRGTPLGDKYDSILTVAEALQRGEWSAKREAGEGSATVLTMAVMSVYALSRDAADTFVRSLSKIEKATVSLDPKIATAIASIKSGRKSSGPSAADILARIQQPS